MDDGEHKPGIVKILKDTFGRCKVRVTRDTLDFKVAVNSKKSDRLWQTVARYCVEKELDPRCYVEWRFLLEFPEYPVPAKFASLAQIDRYVSDGKPDVRYIQVQSHWSLMLYKLNNLVANGTDQVAALVDPIHNFDPVFVYTTASLAGRGLELPERALAEARSHALWNPVYRARFFDLVPAEVFEGGKS